MSSGRSASSIQAARPAKRIRTARARRATRMSILSPVETRIRVPPTPEPAAAPVPHAAATQDPFEAKRAKTPLWKLTSRQPQVAWPRMARLRRRGPFVGSNFFEGIFADFFSCTGRVY